MVDPIAQTTASRAVPLLVCLLRARAATLAGQSVRATMWALAGTVAVLWAVRLDMCRLAWMMEDANAR